MTDRVTDQLLVHHIGPHVLELEPPDVVHVHYDGDVHVEHFITFQQIMTDFAGSRQLYLLRDARKGGFVRQEAREFIAKKVQSKLLTMMVTYGSSFQARTVFAMMSSAARHIRSEAAPAYFFDTEEEARAWIAQHRAQAT